MIVERLLQYALLARLHRPIGILLLLWPTLWGLWIAGDGNPDPLVLIIFVLGVVLMRSAGCVINDYADRNFDLHVARTRDRPMAAGRVSTSEALGLFVVLSLAAFVLVIQLNRLTIQLSLIAIIFAASYPFLKRYTHLPQFYLGAAFGWAIPMGFAAQTNALPAVVWVLFVANVFWAVAYDTQYSMVDRDDDIKIGVKSTAILFGTYDNLLIGLAHAMTLAVLVLAGVLVGLGVFYYLSLAIAAALAVYQQYLTHDRQRDGCFRAFLNNNWLGAAIFCGLVLDYLEVGIP